MLRVRSSHDPVFLDLSLDRLYSILCQKVQESNWNSAGPDVLRKLGVFFFRLAGT